jgi:hypothetical protein
MSSQSVWTQHTVNWLIVNPITTVIITPDTLMTLKNRFPNLKILFSKRGFMRIQDLKAHDDGRLIQITDFLDIIHRPVFLIDHPISQPSLDISPIWTPVITASGEEKKTTTPCSVDWVGKLVFLVLVPYREFHLSRHDFYLDSSLVQDLIRVEFLIF